MTGRRGWGRRGRQAGQTAVLEIGLASALAAALLAVLLNSQQTFTRGQVAIAAGDQQARLAAAVAGYVQANYQGFLGAFTGGTTCGGVAAAGLVAYPIDGVATLPNVQGPAGTACQGIGGIIPTGAPLLNAYRQGFQLVVGQIIPATGQPYLSAILTTAGGQAIPDNLAGIVIKRIGSAGAMLASAANQPVLGGLANGTTGQFQLDPAAWNGAITPGHPLVYLNYALATNVNQNLERFASANDATPNKMDATLYLNGRDSSNGNPVNMALSGPAIPAGTALALAALAGAGVQPRNSLLGARQVDTQTLTGGSSVGNTDTTDLNQAGTEAAAGRTVNDGAFPAYQGHTILANANLNVTSGYRLAAEGGLHVTGSAAVAANGQTITANDRANSANGPLGPVANGQQGDPTAAPVPGVSWDNANGTGLMTFFGTRNGGPQFWIGTYAGGAAFGGVVGIEADGGLRAPVLYDNVNATYYVQPAGDSNLAGSLTLGNTLNAAVDVNAGRNVNAGNDVNAGCNIYADPTIPQEGAMPVYTPCGNVTGWDLHAAGEVYTDNGVLAYAGDLTTQNGNLVTANGYAQVGANVTVGSPCTANGQIAISNTDQTATWCRGGIWHHMNDNFQKYALYSVQLTGSGGANTSGTNNSGGPMMISTNCNDIGSGQNGDYFAVNIFDQTAGIQLTHNLIGDGGSDANFSFSPFGSAIVPAGHAWTVSINAGSHTYIEYCSIVTLS